MSGKTPADAGKECSEPDCGGWAMDNGKCFHCGGQNYGEDHGAPENNNHNQKHGLHTSAETFFEHADQHHLDTYYAVHEALCSRFQDAHGREPMYHDKKELAQVALSIAKLDMADEYAAENAVDPEKPLTENEKRMTEAGMWEKEVVSKIETLKTDIRRENRLLLKDKGIYASPESQKAQAQEDLASLWASELQD
jgi:hypothetical protein